MLAQKSFIICWDMLSNKRKEIKNKLLPQQNCFIFSSIYLIQVARRIFSQISDYALQLAIAINALLLLICHTRYYAQYIGPVFVWTRGKAFKIRYGLRFWIRNKGPLCILILCIKISCAICIAKFILLRFYIMIDKCYKYFRKTKQIQK